MDSPRGDGRVPGVKRRWGRIHIGCSGWNYKSWRGAFYPPRLPASKWLHHYAQRFDTVELNNSFYRLPKEETFRSWREQVPERFIFAVKASRFLTHMKRLRDPEEPLTRLFARTTGLGSQLGPVLYQLPSNFRMDLERLRGFLEVLPGGVRHVFEFRDPTWYVADTFAALERHGATLCLHDKAGSEVMQLEVGSFLYVRFHGTDGRYHGSYADEVLTSWAERLVTTAATGRDAYAYFNNDPHADATRNAATLHGLVDTLLRRHGARSPDGHR